MDFNRNLEKYAELAIKVGVNIQPNQTLLIIVVSWNKYFYKKIVQKQNIIF